MASILVVDPDPSTCTLICTALAMSGHVAASTAEPPLADEELRRNTYDVLILDVSLPSLRGMWLGRLVAAKDPIVPRAILTTTLPDIEHMTQLAALPVFAVFGKPFDLAEFKKAVDDCAAQTAPPRAPRIFAREIFLCGQNPFVPAR
jgi:DNA-binding NtrC family response regulator